MSVALGSASERELRFQAVAAEYLEAREAGRIDELSALLARHADLADEIAAFVAEQDEVAQLAAPLRQAVAPAGEVLPLAPPGEHGRLGDFRIVREAGRGGMGVVYEAEQVSLGRRVALKVLPFAATMDPRQLQRFHNEARAAAGLHHTNIVPVYAVGCERGVHYYAMQFIDGRTLADFITEQRGRALSQVPTVAQPEAAAASATTAPPAAQATSAAPRDAAYFRRVAGWGIQAAEALDCAHTLGVVHRDVKPANLLVDAAGRLWVTDFGLAQVQSDARLTVTGDLVGTLRYMSPEQALAQRVVVDHRTDVYSLGATLYELLTLQPAFGGTDRQELLRQIAFEEPRPPRRINKAIPAELETIVLKAMEKNSTERYATAKELAEDLGRWLEDRPIRARRPSLTQRARKWARRHRALVASAGTVLLLALMILAASLGWMASDRATRRRATEQAVGQALDESDSGQQRRRLPEALSAARRAAGLVAGGEAREDLRRRVNARVADLELLTKLEDIRLEPTAPEDGEFDRAVIDRLFATAFRDAGIDAEALPPEEAAARIRATSVAAELVGMVDFWATMRAQVSSRQDDRARRLLHIARDADDYEIGRRLRDALLSGDRKAFDNLVSQAEPDRLMPGSVVLLAAALGNPDEAIRLLSACQRRHPEDFWLNYDLAVWLEESRPPRLEEAIRYCASAVAIRPQSRETRFKLGVLLGKRGDLESASAEYREVLRSSPDHAPAHNNLGNALKAKGGVAEAIAEYRVAIGLKNDYPEAHNNLANALHQIGRLGEAIAEYREAIRLKEDLAEALNNLAWLLATAAEPRFRDPPEAVRLARRAVQLAPQVGALWSTLGVAHYRASEWQAAVTAFNECIKLSSGGAGGDWFFLAMAHGRLGAKDEASKWYGKAVAWMDKHDPKDEDLRRLRAEAAELLGVKDGPVGNKEVSPPKP